MQKTWFITGSSRGLGKSIVEAAVAAGDTVVATARNPEQVLKHERVRALALDVTDAAQARHAIAEAGPIDIVVNNAGQGLLGGFEEMTPDQFQQQIDLNFFGVVNVTRAALPGLRAQKSGHLIQISSIGGRLGAPGLSGYQAAKFAVEGFSEVLFHELKPLGIKITVVEPGGFRTDWAGASMQWAANPLDDYKAVREFRERVMKRGGYEPGDPDRAAKVIVDLAHAEGEAPLRLPLGTDAYTYLKLAYESNLAELERTKALTTSTDFPGGGEAIKDLAQTFDRR